jgi:hypothetical protein
MLVSFFTNCTIIAKLCAYHTIKINKVCKRWHNCLFPMHKFLTSFWDWIYSNLRWFWTYIGMLLIIWVKYCSFIHCSSFYSFYCLSSWNICCHCLRNILNYLLIVRTFYACLLKIHTTNYQRAHIKTTIYNPGYKTFLLTSQISCPY